MVDLSTEYLGLKLANPLVPSASPLTHELDTARRLEDAGAAAAVSPEKKGTSSGAGLADSKTPRKKPPRRRWARKRPCSYPPAPWEIKSVSRHTRSRAGSYFASASVI